MPRFAILEHDHPFLHWDFLLESGEALRTWRLEKRPDCDREIAAEALADHRVAYLDYQGPISGDRGSVTRWDGGTYRTSSDNGRRLEVELAGERLHGRALLQSAADGGWRFQFLPT